MRRACVFVLLVSGCAGVVLGQASPPALVNYQGVLRNSADVPQSGAFDMVFRLFDAAGAGNQILVDSHLAAGTGAVVVTGGLFDTQVGGGAVADGSGPGVYTTLAEVFRDHDSVYLEVQIGAEVLSPRIRIVSAAYASNADHLDGRSSAFFLDTSAAAQEKTGLLTCSGGIDFGPGASDDLAAADVTSLTGGGSADALHTHTNVANANALDTLDSSQFLRSDTSDSYTSGTLTFADGTRLLADDGSEGAPGIGFSVDPGTGLFYTSDPGTLGLAVSGSKAVEVYITGDVVIGRRLYPGNQGTEYFDWDSAVTSFHLSDDLALERSLRTGSPVPSPGAWNHFGPAGTAPSSGAMNAAGDLFLENDLEVNGAAHLNGELRMDDNGPDGTQTISFFDDGSATNEALQWNDAADRFELTNDLAVSGSLDLGPGGSDDLSAADVTTLTGGGSADTLHTHAGVANSDTLDGLDSTAFARLATANTFAAAVTLNTGGGVNAVFTEDGVDKSNGASDSTFTIQNSGGAGKMTLQVDGIIRAGDPLFDPTSYNYNRIALGAGAPPAGAAVRLRNDLFVEGDLGVNTQIYAGTRVIAESTLVVGDTSPSTSQAFSSFGPGTKDQAGIADANDVYVSADLELDGVLYLQNAIVPAGNLFLEPPAGFDVILGDGASTSNNSMRIGDGSLCVDDDGSCTPPVDGHIKAFVFDAAGHSDLAEIYPSEETLEAGDVVILDRRADGKVRKSSLSYEVGIISVISDRPGFVLGTPTDQELQAHALDPSKGPSFGNELLIPGTYPVALMGRVPVKVNDEGGPIAGGDYLTSSSTPGVAMKATKPGSVIGQALEPWTAKGEGRIGVWIQPRWMGAEQTREPAAAGGAEVPRLDTSVDEGGNAFAEESRRPASLALAEYHPVTEPVELGDVLVVDPDSPGKLKKGNDPSDPAVVGIVSSKPIAAADPELAAIALAGTVPCKVDAGFGAIRVGDLLTVAPTPGHAMRSMDPLPGTILGKALEPLASGTGVIQVLVMLR